MQLARCLRRKPAAGRCFTRFSLFQGAHPRCVRVLAQPTSQEAFSPKKEAAQLCVHKYVSSNSTVGFGSGELVNLVIEEVGRKLAIGQLTSVSGVAACDAAAHSAAFHGVPLLPSATKVDVLVEQVDQLDVAAGAAVKGVCAEPQQPQLPRLRDALQAATTCVLLADESSVVPRLSGTLPVVIEAEDWEDTAEELDDMFIGDAEIWRRSTPGMGPTDPRGGDHPYLSPEGHNLVDVRFESDFVLYSEKVPYRELVEAVEGVQGVVTHGLLLGVAAAAIVARPSGGPHMTALPQAQAQ